MHKSINHFVLTELNNEEIPRLSPLSPPQFTPMIIILGKIIYLKLSLCKHFLTNLKIKVY